MFRLFGLLLVGLVLSGCAVGGEGNPVLTAGNNDATLCLKAFNRVTNQWKRSAAAKPFVKEAKKQGLNCTVNETSNTQLASLSDVLLLSTACKNGFFATDTWSQPYVAEAKSRNLVCFLNGELSTNLESFKLASVGEIDDTNLCIKAFNRVTNKWKRSTKIEPFVTEAKKRGVDCRKQIASSTTSQSNTPTSAELTAAQRKAEELEQQLAALKAQQEKQQQTISNDTQIPLITITSANTKGKQGVIRGSASDNVGLAEVTIDGNAVAVQSNGSFEYSTFVPATGLTVTVQATDMAGLSSNQTVSLQRNVNLASASISFDRLNPIGKPALKNKDAIALIIGIGSYENIIDAAYADKDALMFRDYAAEKLGIPESHIKTLINEDADIGEVLLGIRKWIRRSTKPDKTDVFVFYAGHGIATATGEAYILPYDGRPEVDLLDRTALLQKELFAEIDKANPRNVTIFLDACYTGKARTGEVLMADANYRPIAIRPIDDGMPDNFTLITASSGDEFSGPLEEAKHGLFSYFLMKGMEGDADSNQDNQITSGELHEYVKENVLRQSADKQTPELQGDADRVLVTFK